MSLGHISLVKIKKKLEKEDLYTCLCVLAVDNCFVHTCIVPLSGGGGWMGRSMLFSFGGRKIT